MESAKSGHRTVSGRRIKLVSPARTEAQSQALHRSKKADRYENFAQEVLIDLDPKGALQRLVADQVVQSAWKLKSNLEAQAARDRCEKPEPEAGPSKPRIRPTELDRAARSMREALETLDYLRARLRPSPTPAVLPEEWPVVLVVEEEDQPEASDESEVDSESWRDRLVFDFEVSDVSPVVKGTWVTVGHVVSLIVDGWAWSDILRAHPELTESDIRTCVAYTMAEENASA